MANYVLDASALLAFFQREPGYAAVAEILNDSFMSSVNLAEVLSYSADRGAELQRVEIQCRVLPIRILPFQREDVLLTAELRPITKRFGLSLGDRACLALGQKMGATVITADRVWADLNIGVEIRLIR